MTQRWEHAVLSVDVINTSGQWTYHARAWVGETEIYNRTRDSMFWSGPLADLSRDGWELVSIHSTNALVASHLKGISGPLSYPVSMHFFLKRPTAGGA
jgi:hypothetical protein